MHLDLDTGKALSKVQALVQLIQKRIWVTNTKGKKTTTKTEAEEQREQRSSLFRAETKVTLTE